jgi:hypothetical protein
MSPYYVSIKYSILREPVIHFGEQSIIGGAMSLFGFLGQP